MQNNQYEIFLKRKRDWYKKIGKRYCLVLQTHVVFNSNGFRHLIYNGLGHRRNQSDVLRRLRLLSQVVVIVQKTRSISMYRSNGVIQYWALEKNKIVVILRRIGNGSIHFYSIWRKK